MSMFAYRSVNGHNNVIMFLHMFLVCLLEGFQNDRMDFNETWWKVVEWAKTEPLTFWWDPGKGADPENFI